LKRRCSNLSKRNRKKKKTKRSGTAQI